MAVVPKRVDVRGRACPIPIVELGRAAAGMSSGEEAEVLASDRAFPADVEAWCRRTGNVLVGMESLNGSYVARVRKT